MANIIALSCFRAGNNYAFRTSAELATAITAPYGLKSLSLLQLIQAVQLAGGDAGEFRGIWQFQEYVQRAEAAFGAGDLTAVQALLLVCPVQFSDRTLAALNAVIAANTLQLVNVVAAELSQTAPATVTAADVNAALGRK